ncbi:right-handed parallel beta-helix repeat-containing protein [Hymenobacter latericus]|uniref:right-handed parallel beta-helix repeat-containing protein n=1 Tax=Hymenobacter sp. YIM 151858-1 TaxID=2987688 RepID=UPI0022271575|nr:right-handed parallel beta-helix repeat-containing protein [Hymenobacter sp. YIM 151858-1]UYZ57474.1 right-handed parallel beta-helix repeat-containing protein [Hymenobacter sp. YIM 151858-1]
MKTILRSASVVLLMGAAPAAAWAQTTVYVNDAVTLGDVYTSAPGSDATGTGTAAAPYRTIARALQELPDGSTVRVDAGTYPEQVLLSRNVSVRGAGTAAGGTASATILEGQLLTAPDGNGTSGILITTGGGTPEAPVTIANLTLRNYDFGIQTNNGNGKHDFLIEDVEVANNRRQGVFWNAVGNNPVGSERITFRRLRATGTAFSGGSGGGAGGAGRGLLIQSGHKHAFLIENSVFEQNRRAGIDVNDGSVSGLVIRNCQFGLNGGAAMSILGATGRLAEGGPNVTFAALIENNVIRNNASNGLELKSCTGTGRGAGPGSFVIRNNFILRAIQALPAEPQFDNAGIAFIDRDRNATVLDPTGGFAGNQTTGGAWIEGNVIRGYLPGAGAVLGVNAFGMVLEGANNKVLRNVVSQCEYGIQIQDRPTGSSSALGAYYGASGNNLLVSAGDSINQNRIDSCQVFPLRAINLTNVVNASLNWLGGTDAVAMMGASGTGGLVSTLNGSFNTQNSTGTTGRLDISPYLNSGTDTSPAPGFQPDFSYLNVAASSPSAAGTLGNLQEAVLMLTDGGTIDAAPGSYDESVVVNKNVFLPQEGAPVSVRDLTMNGAGKTLTLRAPLTISNSLTLTNGIISSTSTDLLTVADNATASGGNAGSYVQGPLRKLGNEAFVFPVGQNGVLGRLGISAPNNPSSAFTAEYRAQGVGVTAVQPPLTNASRVEHWLLERTAGNANVAVQLFWEDGTRSGVVSLPELRVARLSGGAWVSEGNTGTSGSAASGSVTSGTVNSFGTFSLASVNPINPLPVELTAFRAEAAGEGKARLHWTTAQEKNNRGFEVERARNGEKWQYVGFVRGAGHSSQPKHYTLLDASGLTDVVYYRLKQLDTDGKATYSPIAAVRLPAALGKLALFPNPATRELNLRLPNPATGAVTVQIVDAAGRTVWSTQIPANGQTLQLDLEHRVKPGLYLVRVSGKGLYDAAQQLVVR